MKIHKEGHRIVLSLTVVSLIVGVLWFVLMNGLPIVFRLIPAAALLFLMAFVLFFFRSPNRMVKGSKNEFLSPADGRVVVVETTMEEEFFRGRMRQISIFMSPFNVHVNRYPTEGKLIFQKYHPGRFLVAWHPKSSLDNERTSLVLETPDGVKYMLRQIAGAVARRIVFYGKEGDQVLQGGELGFIKFGSRVDVFLPLNVQVNVKTGDKVKGGRTILAQL